MLDTSFWINAYRSDLLPHVLRRFTLHSAPQVAAEFEEQFASGQEFWHRLRAGDIIENAPAALYIQEFNLGERAAISLAIEHNDWFLLLDDYKPFVEAARRGLKVVSTPMFAVTLYDEGVIDAAQTLTILGRLAAIQTVSPHLIAASLKPHGRTSNASGR